VGKWLAQLWIGNSEKSGTERLAVGVQINVRVIKATDAGYDIKLALFFWVWLICDHESVCGLGNHYD